MGVEIKMLDTFPWGQDEKVSQRPTPPPPTDKLTHDDLRQWRVDENAPPRRHSSAGHLHKPSGLEVVDKRPKWPKNRFGGSGSVRFMCVGGCFSS